MCKTWKVKAEALKQAVRYSKGWAEKEIFLCKEDNVLNPINQTRPHSR